MKTCDELVTGQDESVRQSSMTASSIMSHHEIFEEPPTSSFLASVIDFIVQIIVMDTALDLDENKKYQSLPMLEPSLYSYVLQLANDSSHLQLKDEGKAVEGLGTI